MSTRDLIGRLTAPLSSLDDALGDFMDHQMAAHHRRRLRRIGQEWVLGRGTKEHHRTRPWWVPGVEVREGNSVEVLVDGVEITERLTREIRAANKHVHMTAWNVDPDFWMGPEGTPELDELLGEASQRIPVRVLMWAGAPIPGYPLSRRRMRHTRDELVDESSVRCMLDSKERPLHCHHEKLVVIDDELAFVGGLDLTYFDGSRYDDQQHVKEKPLGWHDVATVLRGPIVADVARHFNNRWFETAAERLPEPPVQPGAGQVSLQLVRTVPEKTYGFLPKGEFTNLANYLNALRCAEHLVYLENQFLWSPEVVEVLCDKLANPPHDDFRLVVVLPLHPSSGKDTTMGQLSQLLQADAGRGNVLAVTLLGPTRESSGVYVHAKVGIVDDHWITVGSCNLNEHSLYNDTEVNVVSLDEPLAHDTRLRLWAEHLQVPVEELDRPAHEVVDQVWHQQCREQEAARKAGAEPVHRIQYVEGASRRTSRLRGPVMGLVVDG